MNNDWREYYDPQYVLMHHGIKGQKWGVRQYQNPDGTLTAAGKARYGNSSGKVEKFARKAAAWEGRAINARTAFGRGGSEIMAQFRRSKADRLAEKATGDYQLLAINKNMARNSRAASEVNANVAQGLKNRAEASKEGSFKQKHLMEIAIRNLSSANNLEGMGAKYSAVANAKFGTKTVTYISKTIKETTYSPSGRSRNIKDRVAEAIGDQIISNAIKSQTNKISQKIDEKAINNGGYQKKDVAAKAGLNVAANVAARGAVSGGRDVYYRAKNSQKKRWDTMAK